MAEQYLIYLRKSRQDREQELQTGVHDTLQRHRDTLLHLAKERKLNIAEILEEVVSGDTIADRPQMQRLLSLVETGNYAGVLCMEVARLARGKTRDQGVVSETFRYSDTKIITPDKVYDPANEMDEDFFEFSLFMSRQEYKMINKRLNRGRMASLDEGKYIAGAAPYGYEKYKLPKQKGYSLRPDPETAPIVRRIFDLYTVGEPDKTGALQPVGSYRIAKKLNAEGIPSPSGRTWASCSIRDIVMNPTYKGELRWSYRPVTKRMENGVLKISTPTSKNALMRQGIHEPLVSAETWEKAQELRTGSKHSMIPESRTQQNPLTGLLYCGCCGHAMTRMLASGHNKYDRYNCLALGCETISHRADATEDAVLESLQLWLDGYKLQAETAKDTRKEAVGKAAADVQRKEAAVQKLQEQKNRLYDLLEQGIYTTEIFLERSQHLATQLDLAQAELQQSREILDSCTDAANMWQNVVPAVEHVLQTYRKDASAEERNQLLKSALQEIVYNKTLKGQTPVLHIYPKLPQSGNNTAAPQAKGDRAPDL